MNSHQLFPALLLLAIATAGCTGTVAGSVTANPATTGSSPTGTTTGTTVGANVGVSTGTLNPALAALYTVGRKWEYAITGAGAADTYSEEVTEVKDNKATVKHVQKGTTTTHMVDLTSKDISGSVASDPSAKVTLNYSTAKAEKVVVMAGSFDGLHGTGTQEVTSSGATVKSDFEYWVSDKVGLLKSVSTTDIAAAIPANTPGLPPGFTLPTGSGGSKITINIELKSFK